MVLSLVCIASADPIMNVLQQPGGDAGLNDMFTSEVTANPAGEIYTASYDLHSDATLLEAYPAQKPFLIYGHIYYDNGSSCNNPRVSITNLNTDEGWDSETGDGSNYYQIILTSGIDLNASEILRFNAADGTNTNLTDYTITPSDVNNGGVFNFNLTITSLKMGDVDGDGNITSADAAIALRMAVRGEYSRAADVSDDDSVTSLDALMILQAAIDHVAI